MLPQNELHIKITALEFSRTVDINIIGGPTWDRTRDRPVMSRLLYP